MLTVTTHSAMNRRQTWRKVKASIIASRFGTIRALARHLRCHPNSIHGAVLGTCPDIADKMQRLGLIP